MVMKIYNILGFIVALTLYFTGKTVEAIWIMVLLIYTNQNK